MSPAAASSTKLATLAPKPFHVLPSLASAKASTSVAAASSTKSEASLTDHRSSDRDSQRSDPTRDWLTLAEGLTEDEQARLREFLDMARAADLKFLVRFRSAKVIPDPNKLAREKRAVQQPKQYLQQQPQYYDLSNDATPRQYTPSLTAERSSSSPSSVSSVSSSSTGSFDPMIIVDEIFSRHDQQTHHPHDQQLQLQQYQPLEGAGASTTIPDGTNAINLSSDQPTSVLEEEDSEHVDDAAWEETQHVAIYSSYTPQKLAVHCVHPATIVEAVTLATAELPDLTYERKASRSPSLSHVLRACPFLTRVYGLI